VWGQVESSLRFVRLEGLIARHPLKIQEYVGTVLIPRAQTSGPGKPNAVVQGSMTRRIASPRAPAREPGHRDPPCDSDA
jgi:hypothetical protein